MDFSMSPGLEVWLGIRPPEWDEDDYDEDWDDEDFSLKNSKKRNIRILKSDFRRVF